VLTKLCDELDAHLAAEEEAFYPVVRDDVPSGKKLTKEAKNEHGDARQLIGRIRRTSDPDHVDDEEEEMLPLARRALGEDRLIAAGSAYESAKAKAQG
jgi:hemerythrin-like domain-containing protein